MHDRLKSKNLLMSKMPYSELFNNDEPKIKRILTFI